MRKNILLVLLLSFCCVVLCACGSKTTSSSTNSGNKTDSKIIGTWEYDHWYNNKGEEQQGGNSQTTINIYNEEGQYIVRLYYYEDKSKYDETILEYTTDNKGNITYYDNGKVIITDKYEISNDGKTLTLIVDRDDGETVYQVYNKQD